MCDEEEVQAGNGVKSRLDQEEKPSRIQPQPDPGGAVGCELCLSAVPARNKDAAVTLPHPGPGHQPLGLGGRT